MTSTDTSPPCAERASRSQRSARIRQEGAEADLSLLLLGGWVAHDGEPPFVEERRAGPGAAPGAEAELGGDFGQRSRAP